MILIIDDCVDSKIGQFEDLLRKAGFEVNEASTLEEAKEKFKANKNSIETIILDYSFPTSEIDTSVYDKSRVPNGIVFLRDCGDIIKLRGIPLIINTDGDEEYRDKWLQKTIFSNGANIIYKSSSKNPLSCLSGIAAARLVDKIRETKPYSDISSKPKPEQYSWPKYLRDFYKGD